MTDETSLAIIAPLQQALSLATEAGDIDAMRDIAATAAALQKGARARGMGVAAENTAAEVVLRAERAIGRALTLMAERGERRTRGANITRNADRAEGDNLPGLPELGVSPKEAHLWRRLAALWDDATFEEKLAYVKDLGARLSKVDFYRGPKQASKRDAAAVRETKEDERPSQFARWKADSEDLIENMRVLPNDELMDVGLTIRNLVQTYNAVRAAREA